jgi:hypothetical protein
MEREELGVWCSVSEPVPSDELFRVAEMDTGCIRVNTGTQLLHIYESIDEDEPESHIALEMDEARLLLAFLKSVIPNER